MPEYELRPFWNFGVQQVKPAVQIVGMTGDPHGAGSIPSGVAASHIVTDFMWLKVSNEILNQFWRTVAAVAVISALPPLRIRYNAA